VNENYTTKKNYRGGRYMELILSLENRLNDFFKVKELDKDPGFSKFIPMVYDPIGFDWKNYFEQDFTKRFNGQSV
jgi:hypothetical protein